MAPASLPQHLPTICLYAISVSSASAAGSPGLMSAVVVGICNNPWAMRPRINISFALLFLWLALSAGGCAAGDGGLIDEEGWQLNHGVGQTVRLLSPCPNGGKTPPATPAFGSKIDGYASYVGQSKCDPTAKPGVTAFMKFVLAAYPCTTSGGITRSCSSGGTSEHKEGRAWDWMIKVGNPAADSLLGWLLATDKYGNKHAMARRVGVMYMIWNKKMWRAYNPGLGWAPYSGSNPHTDHVHFSFSWDGANKKTSFWSAPPVKPDAGKPPTPDMGKPPTPDMGKPPTPDKGKPPAKDSGSQPAPDARPLDRNTPTRDGLSPAADLPPASVERGQDLRLEGGCATAHNGPPIALWGLLIVLLALRRTRTGREFTFACSRL